MKTQYVVIGGGAGGLELVVKLARKLRRQKDVEVLLVDKNPTHIWKPLFHEVATGSMNSYHDEASYRMLARKHGFKFVLGEVTAINVVEREIALSALTDESGRTLVDERSLHYDRLALAVGSLSNDFGIEGVAEHSRMLDSRDQAERFHRRFTALLHEVNSSADRSRMLSVVIVGGGATGVELAADMHNVARRLREYGFEGFSNERLRVSVVEAGPRLLPQLPQRISASVERELARIGVQVCTNTQVSRVSEDAVYTKQGERIPADISVWAAGIKAPAFLGQCGFPTDRIGRIKVSQELLVEGQEAVFALGDCSACQNGEEGTVPPRAQSAHQMASTAAHNMLAQYRGKSLEPFVYKDFGSLVNLSSFSTIGNLMGNLMRGTMFVEGWLARMAYLSLYRMHQSSVFGPLTTVLIMFGDRIYKATRAEVKLH